MTNGSEDRIDLRGDGRIILYKRAGSKDAVWQARITARKPWLLRVSSSRVHFPHERIISGFSRSALCVTVRQRSGHGVRNTVLRRCIIVRALR